MIDINKILLFICILLISNFSLTVTPNDFLYPNALNVTCKEGSPMQEDLMYCVSRDYIESDRDLNANYRKSLKQLTIAEQGKLRLEQRNWLKVKDKKCNQLYLNMKDGREAPIDFLSCHAEENSKRAKILAVR